MLNESRFTTFCVTSKERSQAHSNPIPSPWKRALDCMIIGQLNYLRPAEVFSVDFLGKQAFSLVAYPFSLFFGPFGQGHVTEQNDCFCCCCCKITNHGDLWFFDRTLWNGVRFLEVSVFFSHLAIIGNNESAIVLKFFEDAPCGEGAIRL